MEKWAKMSFEKLLKETEDRWRWRRLVNELSERGRLKTRQAHDVIEFCCQLLKILDLTYESGKG